MADVEFGTSDVASMLAEMENEESSGNNFVSLTWSPKNEGITKIRFLPQLDSFGEKLFCKKRMIHYIGGKPYFCLAQTLTDKDGNLHEAEPCPICAKSKKYYEMADGNRNSQDWKAAGDLRAKERYVARVIVRGNKDKQGNDTEYKPEFYEFGKKILEMIKSALQSGEYGNPFDLKTGRDFNLSKKGQKKTTDYSGSMFSGNSSPIFTDVQKLKTLLAELKQMDYSKLVSFESPEVLKKVIKNYLDGDSEIDETPAISVNDNLSDDAIYGIAKAATSAPATDESSEIDDILAQI